MTCKTIEKGKSTKYVFVFMSGECLTGKDDGMRLTKLVRFQKNESSYIKAGKRLGSGEEGGGGM